MQNLKTHAQTVSLLGAQAIERYLVALGQDVAMGIIVTSVENKKQQYAAQAVSSANQECKYLQK